MKTEVAIISGWSTYDASATYLRKINNHKHFKLIEVCVCVCVWLQTSIHVDVLALTIWHACYHFNNNSDKNNSDNSNNNNKSSNCNRVTMIIIVKVASNMSRCSTFSTYKIYIFIQKWWIKANINSFIIVFCNKMQVTVTINAMQQLGKVAASLVGSRRTGGWCIGMKFKRKNNNA